MKDAFGVERISKIAMMPVYHGTTAAGAAKLGRYVRAKDPSKSAWRSLTGKPRTDGTPGNPGESRPDGLYVTPYRSKAEGYSLTGRSPNKGGIEQGSSKGKLLTFNAVGVKPKYRDPVQGESIYDPRELGAPLKTETVKRSKVRRTDAQRIEAYQVERDAAILRDRKAGRSSPGESTTAEYQARGRKRVLQSGPAPRSMNDFV
jgi:hypothetical protein